MTVYPIPDLTVEVSWDSPDEPTPTWDDVTEYVRAANAPVTSTRGRSDERADGNDPGSLTLTLDNTSGSFTPGRSDSPFYPNVLPWRRIRVTMSATSTVPLFYGFVKQWAHAWDGGSDGNASRPLVLVTAVDSLALLGRRQLRNVISETVLADSPLAYFPLDEPQGATRALDAVGGDPLVVVTKPGADGTLEFAAGTGPGTDGAAAMTITRGLSGAPYLGLAGSRTVSEWSYECWVNIGTNSTFFYLVSEAVPGEGWYGLLVGATGLPYMFYPGGAMFGTPRIDDGRTHHVVGTVDAAGAAKIYVDGAQVASTAGSAATRTLSNLQVGGAELLPATNTATISHVAIYDTALSAGDVLDHYRAGKGFAGESTFDRIERWCGWVGVDVSNDGAGEGEALGHIPTEGRTVLDCVADALRTDYGSYLLAALDDRAVRFFDRTTRYGASSTITLDCAEDQVDADLTVLMDPTYVASRVTATTPTGVFESRDPDTEAVYGDLGMDVQVYPSDDGFAESLAEGLGRVAASPVPRIPTVSTDLLVMALDTTLYDPTAIPEVGSAVTLVNLPDTAPDEQVDAFVEGLTETISASEWRRTASLSPAYPWMSTWCVEDPVRGEIEAGYVIAL